MSQLFTWGGQSTGASAPASFLPKKSRADLLQNGLVGSPCSPRDSQESSPTPQFKSVKTLMLGGTGGQEEKGTTEDEMAGWHHWLNGRESEWTLGVGDGQGGLACCYSWGHKESDMTERQLNWTDWMWFLSIEISLFTFLVITGLFVFISNSLFALLI